MWNLDLIIIIGHYCKRRTVWWEEPVGGRGGKGNSDRDKYQSQRTEYKYST
jgi:hypothetical protein